MGQCSTNCSLQGCTGYLCLGQLSYSTQRMCFSDPAAENRSSCIAHGRYAYVCIRTHRACIPAIKLSLAHLCAISSLANLSCVGLGRVRVASFFSEESQNLHQGRAVDLSRGQVVKKTSPPWSIESNLPHLVQQRVFAIRHCCISEGLEPAESSVRDRYRQGTSQQPSSCLQQQRAFFSGILFAPKECSWSLGNVPQLVIFSAEPSCIRSCLPGCPADVSVLGTDVATARPLVTRL